MVRYSQLLGLCRASNLRYASGMSNTAGDASADAKHASVSAKQVAIIGAIAGLLSAAISVPTSIWNTNRTSETATHNVELQVASETQKSKAEFLRGKRQILYVQLAIDADALLKAEEDYFDLIAYQKKSTSAIKAMIADNHKPVDKARARFDRESFSVDVMASDAVEQAYENISAVLYQRWRYVEVAANQRVKPPYRVPHEYFDKLNTQSGDLSKARNRFRTTVRKDMETG